MSRTPGGQPPPELPGYSYIRNIGSGGNAEVYLYEQDWPKREVAVKVLKAEDLTGAGARQFTAEANAMAGLAEHPNIASVFSADIAPDGRPYLVMQYYSQPNLGVLARRGQFSVAEVLKIGVQIAGAVETSHRAGILHRDIKPHNILTGRLGALALTDFGIAGAKGTGGAEGMSVPWSPPEVLFSTSGGDELSDVYSLGATIWHLLAGRSPFEEPGGDNTHLALMGRIKADDPPRTGRADVPESLERLLRAAMAKSPAARPQRALDLARELQAIEQELRLPHTQVIVPDDGPAQPGGRAPGPGPGPGGDSGRFGDSTAARPGPGLSAWDPGTARQPAGASRPGDWPPRGGDDDATRQRGPRVVDPQGRSGPPVGPPPGSFAGPGDDDMTRQRGPRLLDPGGFAGGNGPLPPPRERVLPPPPGEEGATIRRGDAPLAGNARSFAGTAVAADDETPGYERASQPGGSRRAALIAGGVVVAVIAAAGGLLALRGGNGGQGQAPAATSLGNGNDQTGLGPGAGPPGTPVIMPSVRGGKAHFTWTYGNPAKGDTFQWRLTGDHRPPQTVKSQSVTLPESSGGKVCIEVRVVRAAGNLSSPYSAPACG